MATNKGIEEGHIIKMAALGRRFKLGDLYHYHQDKFVEGTLCSLLASSICVLVVDANHKLNYDSELRTSMFLFYSCSS